MELATHTPFVPQGVPPVPRVPPVSKPFELTAPKAVRPPSLRDLICAITDFGSDGREVSEF